MNIKRVVKKITKLSSAVLVAMPLALFLCAAVSVRPAMAAGTVSLVRGTVTVTDTAGKSRAVTEKMRVVAGETLVTGPKGEVQLIMDDRGVVGLRQQSQLRIDDYAANGDENDRAVYTLIKGFMRSMTGWIGKISPNNYQLKSRVATIGIRGTDYEAGLVEGSSAASFYAKVTDGEIALAAPSGKVAVLPGRAAVLEFDKATPPRSLDSIPPVFKPSTNETALEALKKAAAADMDAKLQQRRDEIKRAGGLNANGNTRINEACVGSDVPVEALKAFIRAYEGGNAAAIQQTLDPAMLGYQKFMDGIITDFNRQKQIRLHIKDIQVQCGADVTTVQFNWEKRFLDVVSFAPGLLTGHGVSLLRRTGDTWRVVGLAGDNPFSSRSGSLGQLTFSPAISLASVSTIPSQVPVTVQVVDGDLAGLGSLTVQIISSAGDNETFTLPEQSPGRFARSTLPLAAGAVVPSNGVLEVAAGVQFTLRYLDQNPGNNLPPTMLTASVKTSGSVLIPPDTTPDAFSFAPITNAVASTLIPSNVITITGINAAAPISIVGGEYAIGSNAFTNVKATVSNGQQVKVRLTSAAASNGVATATLTVGGVSAIFSVTTAATVLDSTPDAFVFAPKNSVAQSTPIDSTPITITGINVATPVSIVGGTFAIANGAFGVAGNILNNQTLVVRVTSAAAPGSTSSATVNVGGVTAIFAVTTAALVPDTTPDFFSFAPAVNVPLSTAIDSAVTITGINAPTPVSISGGSFSIGGAAFTTSGNISNSESLTVRVTSAALPATAASATVIVGGVAATFTVTTAAPSVNTRPDPFSFAPKFDVAPLTAIDASVQITGINVAVPVSIAGGTFAINNGVFSTSGNISNNQTLTVRVLSSAASLTAASATVTVGGVAVTFTVTTAAIVPDSVPDAFSFAPQNNVATNTLVSSSPVTISGINVPTSINVVGGSYSIDGGGFTSTAGTITVNQKVVVQLLSSAANLAATSATLNVGGVSANFTATTAAATATVTPNAFRFTPQTNVALSTLIDSAGVAINGINVPVPVSIVGGTFSIAGGAFGAAGNITNNQTVVVRVLSSANLATDATATVTIGGVSASFTVTTLAAATIPNAFRFTPQNNVVLSTPIDSAAVTISGINTAVPVSIVGGTFAVAGGAFGASGNITNNQTIVVRVLSSANFATPASATLTIGGVSASFTVTTLTALTTPNAFSFAPQTNVAVSAPIDSAAVVISGINTAVPVSIVGGIFSIAGGGFGSVGNITNNQIIVVRVLSSANFATPASATVTIGGVSATFTVTTLAFVPDTTPNPFTFNAISNAAVSTPVQSNAAVISGINTATPIAIVGGSYAINGGGFSTVPSVITVGQSVVVQVLSAAGNLTTTSATLNIGGVTAIFSVTTQAAITTPNAFAFTSQNAVPPSSLVSSNSVLITGINAPSPISVAGGSYAISGGGFTSANGTILNNQTVVVQLTSSGVVNGAGSATATLTIGGVSATFTTTTWDTVPNAFSFVNLATNPTGPPSCFGTTSQFTTTPVAISGLTAAATVALTALGANPGAAMSINGGGFVSGPATISNGQTIAIRVNTVGSSTSTSGPAVRATVNIGGVTANITQTCQ